MSRKGERAKARTQPATVQTHTHTISVASITGRQPVDTPITTLVHRVSDDNRRRYHDEIQVDPPSPIKRARLQVEDPTPPIPFNNTSEDQVADDRYQMGFDDPPLEERGDMEEDAPKVIKPAFVILHTTGIFEVAIDACDCEDALAAGTDEIQLLRAGLFPATDERPRTAATFEVLDEWMISTLQAKTTMYDFYKMLEKRTDNMGGKVPNRYNAFIRMSREYAHLQMLIRGGRGHDPTGVDGTKPGELAIRCPVCPRPGVNLPEGWENASPEDQYLYIIFLALDACFRLKRRMVSTWGKDPPLSSGWAYCVEYPAYREFLLTVTDQKEMSTCSGLAALDYANTKFARGYSATGVAMGVCARHEFILPNGAGDLQRGERFANIDYVFASFMRYIDHRLFKIISYDIVCQWWKNLKKRLKKLPPLVRLRLVLELVRFVVPKLHINTHTLLCKIAFSLLLVPGSAQTDGEGIERPWANIGGIASSTREMGPGSREDTLNNHWGWWNWQKLLGLADRLRARLDRAKSEYAAQLEAFTTFSTQQQAHVPQWLAMIEEFEADGMKKNPYHVEGLTEAQVLLRLEQEETQRVEAGIPGIHTVSPSSFVAAALEVEDQQRKVRVQVELKKAGTTAQEIDIMALRRDLRRNIRRLRTLQATYTPAAVMELSKHQAPEDEQPENEPLFLPSALSAAQRAEEPVRGLAVIEDELRDAQCGMSLVLLRNQLMIKARFLLYKKLHARHQGPNTRSHTLVARNESKIRLHSKKYQMAREAKLRLADGDESKCSWRKLLESDIRCMEDADDLRKTAAEKKKQTERRLEREALSAEELERQKRNVSESTREVSWIWTCAGMLESDAEMEDALRIEWSKAYARVRRWREEVRLVEEEARRLPISLEYHALEWEGLLMKLDIDGLSAEDAEGAVAYGMKQIDMYRKLAKDVPVTMTELRLGRGKRRQRVEDESDEIIGAEEDEAELRDVRGDVSDKEYILGGGADDD
ncbi:CxC2 domain-containing protein [Mycena sanguinolenta]|uniref:CxC2 domain-containing protein n=1 Tax=Mycena sanguinolenta TaxID=230812 RepID=A0A8H6Y5W8_9AGAR|nr:CxC2 domain-containing protein [Mycena sanguinolenta]